MTITRGRATEASRKQRISNKISTCTEQVAGSSPAPRNSEVKQ